MDYRVVDASAVEQNVLRQRALEAEQQAFAQEMEVKRLEALHKSTRKKDEKEAIAAALETTRGNAETARSRATRLNREGAADDTSVSEARRAFLESWIASLEQEHVSHSVVADQRRRSLEMTGTGAPTDEEKASISANLASNEEAMKVIETSWKTATEELDSLAPAPEGDSE